MGKDKGISEVEQEKHFETIRFNEKFRYEDYPGGWEPAARLEGPGSRRHRGRGAFLQRRPATLRIVDEPFQRAIFRSYNEWLHEFCSYNPQQADRPGDNFDPRHGPYGGGYSPLRQARLSRRPDSDPNQGQRLLRTEVRTYVGSVRGNRDGCQRAHQRHSGRRAHALRGPRPEEPKRREPGFASRQAPAQQFLGNLILSGVLDRHPKLKVVCAEFDVGWVANFVQQVDYWFGRESTFDAERNINQLPAQRVLQEQCFFHLSGRPRRRADHARVRRRQLSVGQRLSARRHHVALFQGNRRPQLRRHRYRRSNKNQSCKRGQALWHKRGIEGFQTAYREAI